MMLKLRQHSHQYGTPRNVILAAVLLFLLHKMTTISWSTPVKVISIPHKVWQVWKETSQELQDELKQFSATWYLHNPEYRYELVHDSVMEGFVERNFRETRPDIADTFARVPDTILRADYLRYLILLAEGGTYIDIDTECSRPIQTWIPDEYQGKAGLVIGIEYDAFNETVGIGFKYPVQFCQWALMASPGNRVLRHVVDRVTTALHDLAKEPLGEIRATTNDEVLGTTGPQIFTHAILESLSLGQDRNYTSSDFTEMTEPILVQDVLILPISAFASGIPHSGSKELGNEEQLLRHHFRGNGGWKSGIH